MSYLYVNPANQLNNVSGGITVVPVSGIALAVHIVGGQNSNTSVDVIGSPNSDDVSTSTDSLATLGLIHGYNDRVDAWTRPRTFAWSSGQSASSGFGFRNTLPISGYVLGTAAVITDLGGAIANVGLKDNDNESPNVEALETQAFTYGYHQGASGWARIGAIVSNSGAAFALKNASYIIDRTNETLGATVFNPDNDDFVGDNVLFVAAHNLGWNEQDNQWSRLRAVPSPSGQNFALLVKPQEPQTYQIFEEGTSLTSGKQFLALYNRSNSVFKIKEVYVTQAGGVAGAAVWIDVCRWNGYQPSGTRVGTNTLDGRVPRSGANLDAVFNMTNLSGADRTILKQIYTHNSNLFGTPGVHESGTSTKGIVPHLLQTTNLAPGAGVPGVQPLTLVSGQGVVVGQALDFTQASGGAYTAHILFTIEPS